MMDRIQVYGVRVDRDLTEEERSAAIEYLTPERKAKALRFRRFKDQEKGILTGLLESYVIRHTLERDGSRSYTLGYGKEGKPYIVEFPGLHYNISHSGSLIVCGIGDELLGIDVEREERYSERVAKRFFHPEEQKDIFSQENEAEKRKIFTMYWVMKESFMKLSGAGFSIPLKTFHCNRQTGEILITDEVPEEWMKLLRDAGLQGDRKPICRFLDVDEGYQCAVCTLLKPDSTKETALGISNDGELRMLNVTGLLAEYGI
ncbi:MAG: 4'-phosphopantetheinyl transferase superfamily protein [Lachnospiraceae bacterium]|nr:4'-phosphopantetheinyl transferase superfamily protein [Lachnospiraceae bacterium]